MTAFSEKRLIIWRGESTHLSFNVIGAGIFAFHRRCLPAQYNNVIRVNPFE